VHKRRVAELTGAAWDAHESLKLKELRAQSAVVALEDATTAAQKAKELELELLRELQVEAGRHGAPQAPANKTVQGPASMQYAIWPPETQPPAKCMANISKGAVKVDSECCFNSPDGTNGTGPYAGDLGVGTGGNNCVARPLGTDGVGVRIYLGCDAGTPTFGESCIMGTDIQGLFPPDTDWAAYSKRAKTVDNCGCVFKVSGPGCWKMNDFDQLPQYKNDTRRFFLYLGEDLCSH
jgi:hypothetical protein